MLIIADSNIPYAPQAFAHIGEVRTVTGRGLTAEQVEKLKTGLYLDE